MVSRKLVLFLAIILSFLNLAACTGGGSGGGSSDPVGEDAGDDVDDTDDGEDGTDDRATYNPLLNVVEDEAENARYLSIFLPDVARIDGVSKTGDPTLFDAVDNMPTSGSLNYEGYMNLIVAGAASANIDGVAVFTVDLSDKSVTGTIDGFRGMVTDADTNNYLVSYDGVLTLTDGVEEAGQFGSHSVINAGGQAGILMNVAGTLDNGLNAFDVDGVFEGNLNGPGGEGLQAKGATSLGRMDVMISGNGVPGPTGTKLPALIAQGTLGAELVPPAP